MEPAASDESKPAVAIYRAPLFNASETFVREHARALTRYRPLLAGRQDKGNIQPSLASSVFLPVGWLESLSASFGGLQGMARRLRAFRPRLVHAHFGPDALDAVDLSRRLEVPLIATLHGYDVSRGDRALLLSGRLSWMRYALRRGELARHGTLFLAVSEAVRKAALARGFPAERTLTHYLGVDLARFAPGSEAEPGLILHVGRLVEKKGTAILLDALARLPDARLLVVGDGPLWGALQRRAAPLGDRVRFLGNLSHEEVVQAMRRASVLATPSVTARDGDAEGLPTVVVEAAACGLPVVATRHSGIPEAVQDGATGFIVPERDADALAAKLALLLGSDDLRGRMGMAARRRAEERFDLARQTERLEALYDMVAQRAEPA